ncbi:MAG: hypothetical protein IKI39_08090, partial [Oscillospiraceae bacterium]|nr:hypothetical protein [Oscillospiraceae bacterium]
SGLIDNFGPPLRGCVFVNGGFRVLASCVSFASSQARKLIHFAARPFKNTAALRASSTTSALRCTAAFLLTVDLAPVLRDA